MVVVSSLMNQIPISISTHSLGHDHNCRHHGYHNHVIDDNHHGCCLIFIESDPHFHRYTFSRSWPQLSSWSPSTWSPLTYYANHQSAWFFYILYFIRSPVPAPHKVMATIICDYHDYVHWPQMLKFMIITTRLLSNHFHLSGNKTVSWLYLSCGVLFPSVHTFFSIGSAIVNLVVITNSRDGCHHHRRRCHHDNIGPKNQTRLG